MSHPQAVRAERTYTRPLPVDELGEGSLGMVVELKWPSRGYTASVLDDEIPPPLLAPESLLLRFLDQLQVWLQRRQQRRQLRTLSDSMLKDIGISRADVEYETSQPFWQG